MFKKTIVTVSVIVLVIAALASTSLASLYYGSQGVNDVYSQGSWGRQAWVETHVTGSSRTVRVGVQKNGVKYGIRATVVSPGFDMTCKSDVVHITGGTVYKDPKNPG